MSLLPPQNVYRNYGMLALVHTHTRVVPLLSVRAPPLVATKPVEQPPLHPDNGRAGLRPSAAKFSHLDQCVVCFAIRAFMARESERI